MSQPSIFKHRGKIVIVTLIVLALACNMPGSGTPPASAPQPTAFDPTKAALEFQATAMSQRLTVQAEVTAQAAPATQAVSLPEQPTIQPPTEALPATQDIEARIKSAKILVYEDTPY